MNTERDIVAHLRALDFDDAVALIAELEAQLAEITAQLAARDAEINP